MIIRLASRRSGGGEAVGSGGDCAGWGAARGLLDANMHPVSPAALCRLDDTLIARVRSGTLMRAAERCVVARRAKGEDVYWHRETFEV